MWSGPTANWLASPDEKSLIADLNQAKLLWTSEDKACGGVRGQSRRYGGRVGMKPSAGGASPIVYRDKVYFYFLEPKGAVSSNISYNHDPRVMAEQFLADPKLVSQGFNKEQFLDLWRIEANDVVLCMDADTGKTIWKKSSRTDSTTTIGASRATQITPRLQVPERSSFTAAWVS